MPVCAVGRGGDGDRTRGLHERVGTRAVVKGDGVGGEVDAVGDVVPDHRVESRAPLAHAVDVPSQTSVARAGLAADQAVLHLREVALEEVDLVLERGARGVGAGAHHAEVVKDLAGVDGGRGLRDELGAAHVLAVPVRGRVDGHLYSLFGGCVGGVLVAWGEVDVFGDGAAAVDVVLVRRDLVGPRPYGICQG